MNHDALRLMQTYLSGLQVDTSLCGLTRVGRDWRDENYRPAYSKFYFIREGEGTLKVGDRVFHPRPGQIALMPEGTLQSYGLSDGPPYCKYWCHFTARVGTTSLFDLVTVPLVVDVPPADVPHLEASFEVLLTHRDNPEPWSPLLRKTAILNLVSWYLAHSPQLSPALDPAAPEGRLQRCLDHIEAHLAHPMDLDDLAETVHLQSAYFSRLFKRAFGMPPLAYVRSRRLEETKRLLAVPALTLADIGPRVGIENPFYLSRLFKSYTGFSPSQYRAMMLHRQVPG